MRSVLLVEPNPHGHRFSYVRYFCEFHPGGDRPVLLTSVGASQRPEFREQLADRDIEVLEVFDRETPGSRQIARGIAEVLSERSIDHVVVMDADHPLKRWWLEAGREFRSLPSRPEVAFLLTRYPLKVTWKRPTVWVRRLGMVALVMMALRTRTLSRAVALSGRGERRRGLVVRRVADPAHCSASAVDQARLRERHDLPGGDIIVGVFGVLTMDKNIALLVRAVQSMGPGVKVLLGGSLQPDAKKWLEDLSGDDRSRVLLRSGYLPEDVLDELVASCNAVAVIMNYDRPSAVMGKALAAGVPVISACSRIRARELAVTGGGVSVPLVRSELSRMLQEITSWETLEGDAGPHAASPRALVDALIGEEAPAS